MCGRYQLAITFPELVEALRLSCPDPGWTPRWNIAPTQDVLGLFRDGQTRSARLLRWGFAPPWADKPLINARIEDAAAKRTWSGPLLHRRCLVPATGFYEWAREGKTRQPMLLTGPEHLLTFAALWDSFTVNGERRDCVVILTRPARGPLATIHNREPAALDLRSRRAWMDPTLQDVPELIRLCEGDGPPLQMRPVSAAINKVGAEGPHLLS